MNNELQGESRANKPLIDSLLKAAILSFIPASLIGAIAFCWIIIPNFADIHNARFFDDAVISAATTAQCSWMAFIVIGLLADITTTTE